MTHSLTQRAIARIQRINRIPRSEIAWTVALNMSGAWHAAPEMDYWRQIDWDAGTVSAWANVDGDVLLGTFDIADVDRAGAV